MEGKIFTNSENINRILNDILKTKSRKDIEEILLKNVIHSLPYVEGGIVVRNVKSIGLIFFTAKYGIFENFTVEYTFLKDTIIEYVLDGGKPYIVNSFDDFPPTKSSLPFIPYIDMGFHLIFIPIKMGDVLYNHEFELQPYIVVLALKEPITNKHIEEILPVIEDHKKIFALIFSSLILKKTTKLTNITSNMFKHTLAQKYISLNRYLEHLLKASVSMIDGAQKASLLVNTPMGMQFIATYGYDTKKFLSLPPIPISDLLRWYHIGENNLYEGKPRILTHREIQVLAQSELIGKVEPSTQFIQANLAIPVIIDGKLHLFLNLDNFETPTAFDDLDIYIAKTLSTYLASAYELIRRQQRIRRQETLLGHLTLLAETMSDEKYMWSIVSKHEKLTRTHIFNLLEDIIKNATKTFNPYLIRITHTTGNLPTFDDIPEELKDIVDIAIEEIENRTFILKNLGNFHILLMQKQFTLEDLRTYIYILLVKKRDVWTYSDIRYLLSTIDAAILFGNNLIYISNIREMQKETMILLGKALELRDIETKGHTERVAFYTRRLAQAINFKYIEEITWGAYLHDIGKIAIPDYILLKPGKLTEEEFEIMKKHVIYGYELAKNIKGLSQITLNVIKYHHEKWDGSGYPEGLKGIEIPLEARIFAVIDVFDALVSERPYKKPWPIDKALDLIDKEAGRHFDPMIAETFIDLVRNQHMLEDYEASPIM